MDLLLGNLPWMTWNLFLAAVPAALSVPLFAAGRRVTVLWCLGVLAFVAFLPNAPYVLTDVIHLVRQFRFARDDALLTAALGLQFGLFFLAGFGCYLLALARLQRWLAARGWAPWALPVEIVLHALCAVGIFLGRVLRFNSWDVVTEPEKVTGVIRVPQPTTVVLLAFTFGVLVVATTAAKALRWAIRAAI
jgi:uncharacterized membrane protein